MAYLYETHLHTCRGSACASAQGRDYIKYYLDSGYSGIFVTEHFYRGNCTVDRRLPWREWVNEFCRGFEETREEGLRLGLDVFFGWEETYKGDDYLIYGLDKDWLLEHPEVKNWTRRAQYQAVTAAGGCVVHAHPFRQHHYIGEVCLAPKLIDAVEAANAGNQRQYYDVLALRYAGKLGLPLCAGSDIHHIDQAKEGDLYGIYLEQKLESAAGFAAVIRDRGMQDPGNLKVKKDRLKSLGDERIGLPLKILDGYERVTSRDFWAFLEKD
ncbi:MAG: PHP domain-containing protein [Treponema sp.]|jgi:hypothetical protein|nr:PHP domain-containing protein [Treponema sp.]